MGGGLRGIFRWSSTQDSNWDAWYPLSERQILDFPVCEQCGIAVDYLIIAPGVSDEEIRTDLERLRDYILEISDHGHHCMPITGQLAPGQQVPSQNC